MIQSDVKSWPPRRLIRKFYKKILKFRQWLTQGIQLTDGQYDYRFQCETVREFNRYLKMFSKEPGTVEWIDQNVRPGEVFYDIGANIGVFTILAAARTGKNGRVYSFEPHGANFAKLIDNITVNNLQQIVSPNNFALHNTEGFFPFLYKSGNVGTSDSQLSAHHDPSARQNAHMIRELKYATTIDRLIDSGEIQPPHHIKIDVDGNEILILEGMHRLLSGADRPLSIQVEMNDPHKTRITQFLQGHQYQLAHKHFTKSQARKKAGGCDPEALGYNAIFRRAG
jgi:FkbM family methyltransferase